MGEAVRCSRHPGARAGWRCRSCGAQLCPGCTFVQQSARTEIPSCVHCRGIAEPVTIHRRELRSFLARVPGALAYPFVPGTLLGVVAAAAIFALLSYGGIVGAILRYGAYWSFLFSVIRQTSTGKRTYEPSELTETGADLVFAAFRGFVGVALVWVPALVYLVVRHAGSPDLSNVAGDPLVWGIAVAGLVYAPAALMHGAAGGSTLSMLNPVVTISFIARLGVDYLLAVVAIALLGVADVALSIVAVAVKAMPVPFLSRIASEVIALLVPTMMARVLGLLLYVRGDALDYGPAEDYLEPALPGAVPRGREPVLATVALAPAEAAPPIELARKPEPAPAPPPDPVAEIARALEASDASRAAALFAEYRGPANAIDARGLFEIARAAFQRGQHPLAARALHAAGTRDDAAVAPNALLALARVYERNFGNSADAQVLQHLVARWPESTAAPEARASLAATTPA